MPHVHARRCSPSCAGFSGIAQHGKIGHPNVHGCVAKPGPHDHVPKSVFQFTWKWLAAFSPNVPKITKTFHPQLSQSYNSCCDEGHYNEWRHPVGGLSHRVIASGGNERNDDTCDDNNQYPGNTIGHGIVQLGHGEIKRDTHGSGGYSDHGSCQKTKEDSIGYIIQDNQFFATYFF